MIKGVWTAKGRLGGRIIAKCIPEWRFAGHFEYMESISCQNQLILDAWRRYLAAKGRFYRPRLLRECIRAIFCQECGPSSARSAFRGCSIRRALLCCPRMRFEDASSRVLWLCKRTKDGYCCVPPMPVGPFDAVGLWAMHCCEASGVGCRY